MRRLLAVVGLVGVMLVGVPVVGMAPVASAAIDLNPCDDKDAPSPVMPDPMNVGPDGKVDPFPFGKTSESPLARFGFAGLYWSTRDVSNCTAVTTHGSNTLANAVLSVSQEVASWAIRARDAAADLTAFARFDAQLGTLTSGVSRGAMQWLGVALALSAVGLLVRMMDADMSGALASIMATVACLAFGSMLIANPAAVVHWGDTITIGSIQASSAAMTGVGGPGDDRDRMYDILMFRPWCAGLGFDSDIPDQRQICDATLGLQATSYAEMAARDPKLNAHKAAVWASLADDIKTRYPQQYDTWRGAANSRIGSAIFALIAAIAVGSLVLFLSLMVIVYALGRRLLLIIGPLFVVLAVPEMTRAASRAWLNLLLGTVFKGIALGIVTSAVTAMYAVFLGDAALPATFRVLVGAGITGTLLIFRKPLSAAWGRVGVDGARSAIGDRMATHGRRAVRHVASQSVSQVQSSWQSAATVGATGGAAAVGAAIGSRYEGWSERRAQSRAAGHTTVPVGGQEQRAPSQPKPSPAQPWSDPSKVGMPKPQTSGDFSPVVSGTMRSPSAADTKAWATPQNEVRPDRVDGGRVPIAGPLEHRPSPVYLPPSKGKEATRTVGEVRGAPGPVFVPQPPVRDVAAEARRTRQAEFDSRISRTIEGIDRRRG